MLSNYDLYIEFFDKTSKLNIEFIKVEGHKRKDIKNEIDNIFNLVDKASRSFLRNIVLSWLSQIDTQIQVEIIKIMFLNQN